MPKKPTTDSGYISFGKDGSVSKHAFRLPDSKSGQEEEVANRFVAHLNKRGEPQQKIEMLPEHDHDFAIADSNGKHTVVQMTEITGRDYLRKITRQEYDENTPSRMVFISYDEIYAIEGDRARDMVVNKIQQKKAKNYQKPQNQKFWLLIWSVGQTIAYTFNGSEKDECVINAEDYLARESASPFDAVWVFDIERIPYLLKPIPKNQNILAPQLPLASSGTRTVAVYIPAHNMKVGAKPADVKNRPDKKR